MQDTLRLSENLTQNQESEKAALNSEMTLKYEEGQMGAFQAYETTSQKFQYGVDSGKPGEPPVVWAQKMRDQ